MLNNYSKLSPEKLEEHLSNYLIEHWSISALRTFIRNEKEFERRYIFKQRDQKMGEAALVGVAYHETLDAVFNHYKETKEKMSIDEMMIIGHDAIEMFEASKYKLGASNESIEEMKQSIVKKFNFAITNFAKEFDGYVSNIEEVVDVERMFKQFVVTNGYEVPLPLVGVPDLIYVNKFGELSIIDHKTKGAYTKEENIDMTYAGQSLAYTLLVEAELASGSYDKLIERFPGVAEGVKNFSFYENKITENKDRSQQIREIKINLKDSRPLYETILHEQLLRLIRAVNDPDYIYLVNPDDNFVEGSEMIDFWVQTHLEDLSQFQNMSEAVKLKLAGRKGAIQNSALRALPKHVIDEFKTHTRQFLTFTNMDNLTPAQRIEHRLKSLRNPIFVRVDKVIDGFSNDLYLLEVDAGTQIKQIFNYRLDIANALGKESVRMRQNLIIQDGKSYVGVEANRDDQRALYLDEIVLTKGSWKVPLGKDNFGNIVSWDLDNPSTPHLLGGGASGSGKSVAIRSMIYAIKAQQGANADITILDPKREFGDIEGAVVIQDTNEMEEFIDSLVDEMNRIFKDTANLSSTEREQRARNKKRIVIIDELNDVLTMTSTDPSWNPDTKRTFKNNNLLLVQKARSAGFHFAEFSQRLTSKAMDGNAKVNFPCRLCLAMPSVVDSRVILDQEGAENLKGRGDGLFISPEYREPQRIQCFAVRPNQK